MASSVVETPTLDKRAHYLRTRTLTNRQNTSWMQSPQGTKLPCGEVNNVKIGIIICDRYRSCGGGKCFRAMRERTGEFGR
jgi:hypothetical protein